MQSNSPPFPLSPFAFNADLSEGGFQGTRVLFFTSLLLYQGGGMDLSRVGEKFLNSVRSARSIGLLPQVSDRPEVPARAAAAAAVARALAGLPANQRHGLSTSSEELTSIYGTKSQAQIVEEPEEEFYEEEFDPVRHVLEHVPSEENELAYFEEKAALRLAQLDLIGERLSHHVMAHHEVMVKGMQLVKELEKDLKVANVICMNGRRHLTSSRNEVSRDLIVTTCSKKKQSLLDMVPILTEIRHALDMQLALEKHVEEGKFSKAFQVLSEYLQLLDSLSELSAIQEMSRGVEVWLGRTLQKLDSLLLGVCQDFKEDTYITVVDAYALIGDASGLAEKVQSFFMQEVLSETHSVLKNILLEDLEASSAQSNCSRLTYSDLCHQIPEPKFRQCLLSTLSVLFKILGSYFAIMSFEPENMILESQMPIIDQQQDCHNGLSGFPDNVSTAETLTSSSMSYQEPFQEVTEKTNRLAHISSTDAPAMNDAKGTNCPDLINDSIDDGSEASSSRSPWFQLRKDATTYVSQTLQRGRKNLWQLTTSRVSVLLSSAAVCSTSIHQFLRNYEDLNVFILAGEAFCGFKAVEFRLKVKAICENYFVTFHRQNIYALKMVLEKENWLKLPPETIQVVSFAGLVGDGAALIIPSEKNARNNRVLYLNNSEDSVENDVKKGGFSLWLENGNPFLAKLSLKDCLDIFPLESGGKLNESSPRHAFVTRNSNSHHVNGKSPHSEDENEDLLADFIDEDSQLPSRISRSGHSRKNSSYGSGEEVSAQTGSSLCLLRSMDKYARLMQKLEIVNVEFFKGICQLFGVFFHFVFDTFGQQSSYPNGKGLNDMLSSRLKTTLSRIAQDCEQWIGPQSASSSSPKSLNSTLGHIDVIPTGPPSANFGQTQSFGLKERCASADTISLVARLMYRSKSHLQAMLLQSNPAIVEDFYTHFVDAAQDLTQHIHRTTARTLLHINGYIDRIANAKWEVKELGLEHNGYVDLLLGEFKHYRTRLVHGGIQKEVQDLLLEYGVEIVAETLVEGLSRVKRCTDEGRALMSLDLQVLINGLQHFASSDSVKPKFQIVDTFVKAYYLPETEYVHWARIHQEYSKSQIVGLVNLVATMKGWKRKTRLEVVEKIEGAP
ncbi:syndetin [Impatiens glandulifera]|uniref:syndetin n=1 Tax=Impatiens glandulifera TaxID=253017 RepID=UPI001FB0A7EF|nr:syndetin [Impatiens glandulifera]